METPAARGRQRSIDSPPLKGWQAKPDGVVHDGTTRLECNHPAPAGHPSGGGEWRRRPPGAGNAALIPLRWRGGRRSLTGWFTMAQRDLNATTPPLRGTPPEEGNGDAGRQGQATQH
ncbi:hypothetical protein CATMQ487_28040 [Sphaerotilus microaerophilus]|uniref:Uncharacterized protein n=1 Tax=Sphaerotilus microaerophilus TaxID=2914710 RepID=A0ABN6PKY3_9BURK|nr:hypothetical protein CATMQ487_28040 [Sphaerotilus sp. FB-5]